jgi:plastocyanin
MNGKVIVAAVAVVVIAGLGWYFFGSKPSSQAATPMIDQSMADSATPIPTSSLNPNQTVTYTDQGFSPQFVTIPQGGTVMFVNQSSHSMWVGSGSHPAHTGYDGTSRNQHCASSYVGAAPFDECKNDAPGGSWAFTFDKVGTWPYHNHSAEQDFGSVTVVTAPASSSPTPNGAL